MGNLYDKPDGNKKELVLFLRAYGASYRDTPSRIKGQADGIVGYRRVDCQVEFKRPGADPTVEQETFANTWRGYPPVVLRTKEDCVKLLKEMQDSRYLG